MRVVAKLGTSPTYTTDVRAAAVDAAARGRVGLGSVQSTTPVAPSSDSGSVGADSDSQSGASTQQAAAFDQSGSSSSGFSLSPAIYSQLLSMQEVSSDSGSASAMRSATSAYSASSSLGDSAAPEDESMQIPGLPTLSSGRRLDLSI